MCQSRVTQCQNNLIFFSFLLAPLVVLLYYMKPKAPLGISLGISLIPPILFNWQLVVNTVSQLYYKLQDIDNQHDLKMIIINTYSHSPPFYCPSIILLAHYDLLMMNYYFLANSATDHSHLRVLAIGGPFYMLTVALCAMLYVIFDSPIYKLTR